MFNVLDTDGTSFTRESFDTSKLETMVSKKMIKSFSVDDKGIKVVMSIDIESIQDLL